MWSMADFGEQLARLEEQREDGQITDEEYRDLRTQFLEARDRGSRRLMIGAVTIVLLVVVVVIATAA